MIESWTKEYGCGSFKGASEVFLKKVKVKLNKLKN
jgi:hypothetical protein